MASDPSSFSCARCKAVGHGEKSALLDSGWREVTAEDAEPFTLCPDCVPVVFGTATAATVEPPTTPVAAVPSSEEITKPITIGPPPRKRKKTLR